MSNKKNNKTFLYVDGTNLLAGLVDMFGYSKVPPFSSILKIINKYYKINQIYFYASYTPSKNVRKEKIKKQIGLEIEFYKEVRETKNLTFYQGYRSPASKKEKGVDVHLALDFVKDGFYKKYKKAIMLSGDADLIYPVQLAKNLGFSVFSIFVSSRFSRGIMFESESTLILDYKNKFKLKKVKGIKSKFEVAQIKLAQKNPRSRRAR